MNESGVREIEFFVDDCASNPVRAFFKGFSSGSRKSFGDDITQLLTTNEARRCPCRRAGHACAGDGTDAARVTATVEESASWVVALQLAVLVDAGERAAHVSIDILDTGSAVAARRHCSRDKGRRR